ncbi:DUF1127 domain-containing protein [Escherichia sp. E2586]|nr:DUF1127 domain-containing protein [Escherichia sp. E2586]
MEFHENKAKAPFIGLVQLWQAVRSWWLKKQTRRVLQQMSDERLRDIGLRREDVEVRGNSPSRVGKGRET